MKTKQMDAWAGEFGRAYTDRNDLTPEQAEAVYRSRYGVTRTELYGDLLSGRLDPEARILEVGANIGIQLTLLQRLGFTNLYGIEIQDYAIELAKTKTQRIHIAQGSALDVPFKDGWFDLVFTAGVLIHVHPNDLPRAMAEIRRCSRAHILGFEYYSEKLVGRHYRGQDDLLWKANYSQLYMDAFADLELVEERRLKNSNSDNVDTLFLLRRVEIASVPSKAGQR